MAKRILSALSIFVCLRTAISLSGEEVRCDKPPEFERSKPCRKDEVFPVGKSIKYCCEPGFQFSRGIVSATCALEDGRAKWNVPKHICQAVSCSPPDPVENGRIIGSRYTFPNSVKYECNKGYELRGLQTRYCATNAEWTGRTPRCEIVTCPEPEEIENGNVKYSSTKYKSVAKYECVPGYRIEGRNERRCTHQGVWDGNAPTCIEVVCPEPANPDNGKVIVHGGMRRDDLISFVCDEGTQLIGAALAKCMDDGTWSDEPPLCTKPCVVPRLHRGKLGIEETVWKWGSWRKAFTEARPQEVYKHGEKLLLRCDGGYELPVEDLVPGDVEVVCEGGAFNPVPACHPAWCRRPLPDNGRGIPPSPPYNKEDGSVIEYRDPCANIGETLRPKTASCNRGSWIVTDEVCNDPRCKAEDLKLLFVKTDQEFYPDGGTLEVQCTNGYDKQSVDRIPCSNGKWQVTQPPCRPASCTYRPPDIDNGKVQEFSYEHGSNVTYSCLYPYHLVSRGPVTCLNGQWTGTLPSCENQPCIVPLLHNGKMGIYERGRTQKFKQTNPLSSVTAGEKLLLRCNEGYELPIEDLIPGDVEMTCDGGEFKPAKPSCHPAWCRKPLPDNGNGIPPSPPYNKENGSLVVYQDSCLNIGRKLKEKTALCYRGTWIVTEEECEDSRCKGEELGHLFVDVDEEQRFFSDGEILEVQCKIGYESTEASRISCRNGQWQISSAPCKHASCRYPPPQIEYGEATISSGEHATSVKYTCYPPYKLVSQGSVACSHGQWVGTLPICKDNRCRTHSFSVYEGVKAENKTIEDGGSYTPICRDGYDSLEVELQCRSGTWGHSTRSTRKFCKPGNCIVPYVAHGDFYYLKVSSHWWHGETRNFIKVAPDSPASHNVKLYFRCRGDRKFQGKYSSDGDGVEVFCRNKQWAPKPECWYFPPETTAAPSTTASTERATEPKTDGEDALGNVTAGSEMNETGENLDRNETDPNSLSDSSEKSCSYANNDTELLIFFEDQVVDNGRLPDGHVIKFGCRNIGSFRLRGAETAICRNGEWKPNGFPKCLRPERADQVTIILHSSKEFQIRPGDVALVWKNETVNVICYDVTGKPTPPHLYHSDFTKNITGTQKKLENRNRVYNHIRLESMKEEYTGKYTCSSDTDSHSITLELADAEGSQRTFCPTLNATDRLLINYDPHEKQILPGTRATFTCEDVMSKLQGRKSIRCLNNGNWSSSPPICVRSCEQLLDVRNGYKTGDSSTVGSVVTYRCRRGYKLTGKSKLTCQENSLWSHNLPRCSEIFCHLPAKVDNAVVRYSSLRFDSVINYECKSGYDLFGNSTARCNENGEWTNSPPVCKEKHNQCDSNELLANLPEGIFGKNITGEYMPSGSVIELVCGDDSHVITGEKYATCTAEGYWKTGSANCIVGCRPVEKPHNSSLVIEETKDSYRFGDQLTFSCPDGQRLSTDVEVIVCLRMGWSDKRVPECVSRNL